MEKIKVEDLTYIYPGTDKAAVDKVNFNVNDGEMLAICGATGSGKSTLLRLINPSITASMTGNISGNVIFSDADKRIGYVGQNPSEQIVTDKVWHEMAFGMENLGIQKDRMANRIAELSAYFGMEDWLDKDTFALSGGEQQMLNLAAVMAMDPQILILDEPTSRLDPVSAQSFITAVEKLHRDLSLTIIIAEHRLEEIIPICDRLLILKAGGIACLDKPDKAILSIGEEDELYEALPAAYRVFKGLCPDMDIPVSISEGRNALRRLLAGSYAPRDRKPAAREKADTYSENVKDNMDCVTESAHTADKKPGHYKYNDGTVPGSDDGTYALELSHVYFRYQKDMADVLSDMSLSVRNGEILCVLGGNGTGKTTAANIAAGLIRPYSGTVKVFGKPISGYKNQSLYNECLTMLPQDVENLFLYDSVKEELESMKYDPETNPIHITGGLYERHPYDLSGGERQLLALAKVMSTKPKLLILDEPTKGLDASIKKNLIRILREFKSKGVTCLIVTHDADFAAECADRCALCFRGRIASVDRPDVFFRNNRFYTTSCCRIGYGMLEGYPAVEGMRNKLFEITGTH